MLFTDGYLDLGDGGVPWVKMLEKAFLCQFCIIDWPEGVPCPGKGFHPRHTDSKLLRIVALNLPKIASWTKSELFFLHFALELHF